MRSRLNCLSCWLRCRSCRSAGTWRQAVNVCCLSSTGTPEAVVSVGFVIRVACRSWWLPVAPVCGHGGLAIQWIDSVVSIDAAYRHTLPELPHGDATLQVHGA